MRNLRTHWQDHKPLSQHRLRIEVAENGNASKNLEIPEI